MVTPPYLTLWGGRGTKIQQTTQNLGKKWVCALRLTLMWNLKTQGAPLRHIFIWRVSLLGHVGSWKPGLSGYNSAKSNCTKWAGINLFTPQATGVTRCKCRPSGSGWFHPLPPSSPTRDEWRKNRNDTRAAQKQLPSRPTSTCGQGRDQSRVLLFLSSQNSCLVPRSLIKNPKKHLENMFIVLYMSIFPFKGRGI